MRTGAEEPGARVVMLHKQGGLFRIIVQNIHEKVSDRFDTRGAGILTPASVGKEFLSGDVPPSPSPVRSLRPGPGDHHRQGRPDRDAPHPHLLVATAPAQMGLANSPTPRPAYTTRCKSAKPAPTESTGPHCEHRCPAHLNRLPALTCFLLRSCVHHCPPIRLACPQEGPGDDLVSRKFTRPGRLWCPRHGRHRYGPP
jgi:hypothetical protein